VHIYTVTGLLSEIVCGGVWDYLSGHKSNTRPSTKQKVLQQRLCPYPGPNWWGGSLNGDTLHRKIVRLALIPSNMHQVWSRSGRQKQKVYSWLKKEKNSSEPSDKLMSFQLILMENQKQLSLLNISILATENVSMLMFNCISTMLIQGFTCIIFSFFF